MASQAVTAASQNLTVLELQSFVRGYHAYQAIWDPKVGDTLRLEREPTNTRDKFAVAIVDARKRIVGHVPYTIAPTVSHFLKRNVNKGTVQVTGERINRGAGYGVEIPCKYRLYGPKVYTEMLKRTLSNNVH